MQVNAQMPRAVEPLKFLVGTWRSVSAAGEFPPRIKPFSYAEQLEFTCIGQPIVMYRSRSWLPEDGTPLHFESGFLKMEENDCEKVSWCIAHNFGLTTIEEGTVRDGRILVKTKDIAASSQNHFVRVTEIRREFTLKQNGQLQLILHMATEKNPEAIQHLVAVYDKIDD